MAAGSSDKLSRNAVAVLGESGQRGREPYISAESLSPFAEHRFEQLLRADHLLGRAYRSCHRGW